MAVPAVFADTFPAGHGNIFSGAGATEDGSAHVIALIGTEDGAPVHTLAAFTFIVEDVTCPDGSDGIILTALNEGHGHFIRLTLKSEAVDRF